MRNRAHQTLRAEAGDVRDSESAALQSPFRAIVASLASPEDATLFVFGRRRREVPAILRRSSLVRRQMDSTVGRAHGSGWGSCESLQRIFHRLVFQQYRFGGENLAQVTLRAGGFSG